MIIKEFCPSPMQNKIKEPPKDDSIINNPLRITDEICQSMHEPIWSTYSYISLT